MFTKYNKIIFLLLSIFVLPLYNFAQEKILKEQFTLWDIVNDSMTTNWVDGLFTGNGLLGNMVYLSNDNALRIDIGRTDVYDHRNADSVSHLFTKARLPIGHFLFKPKGKILYANDRLDLWNAEITGEIKTDKGSIIWKTLTFAEKDLILFQYETKGSEELDSFDWVPEVSVSPRIHFKQPVNTYVPNPKGTLAKKELVNYYWQPMSAGGGYVTAWKQGLNKILISVGYDQRSDAVIDQTIQTVSRVKPDDISRFVDAHRLWWKYYYQKSLLFIPDNKLESFYWIQLYKIASATRNDKPALDLQGPWTKETPWPGYWFNLNMQLEYSPLFTSNHLDIAQSLIQMIDTNEPNLKKNIPTKYQKNGIGLGRSGGPDMLSDPIKVDIELGSSASDAELELGNLNWLLYYYWEYYAYSNDAATKGKLVSLLTKSTNYFLYLIRKEDDGWYHLPYSFSPEYPKGLTRDCNYALALLKWSCKTLLNLDPKNPLATSWKDVLAHLTDYPKDSTGLRIGRDVGFTQSHRHYSHLLMIYPLQLMNWEQLENRSLIQTSLNTWHKNQSALQGYSFTGGASIYAMMGDGDNAYKYLQTLLRKYVKHNTMYLESGPVIETPLAAATSIQELVLQSRDNKVFVFPAVPSSWSDLSFENFTTVGGFLMSAVRKNGCTKWISVECTYDGLFTLVSKENFKYLRKKVNQLENITLKDNEITFTMKKGEKFFIFNDEKDLSAKVAPTISSQKNSWGIKSKNIQN